MRATSAVKTYTVAALSVGVYTLSIMLASFVSRVTLTNKSFRTLGKPTIVVPNMHQSIQPSP